MNLGWYDPKNFNIKEYEYYENVMNGDLNWIIPGKMLAFSTPVDSVDRLIPGQSFGTSFYIPILKKFGVSLIIRLNSKEYNREAFIKAGFRHIDLYFDDGQAPSDTILQQFFDEVDKEKGAVAIHCKAGLGRTGTLISAYGIRQYKIPAAAMIAWNRICRPGSILGPQQGYLIVF